MRLTNRTRLLSVGLSGVLAIGILGAAGVAMADQPGSGSPTARDGGQDRGHDKGQKLGRITAAQLIKASGLDKAVVEAGLKDGKSLGEIFAANNVNTANVVKTVLGDLETRLNKAVKKNKLTQAKAAEILGHAKDEVQKVLDHKGKPGGQGHDGHERVLKGELQAAAGAIGISEQDLVKELRADKTIAQVAGAHSVPVQKVIDAMVSTANTAIDKAAADGKIKPENVVAAKAKALAAITKLVNEGHPHHGGR